MYTAHIVTTVYGAETGDEFIRPEIHSEYRLEDFDRLSDIVRWVQRHLHVDNIIGPREYGYAARHCALVGTEEMYDGSTVSTHITLAGMGPAQRSDVIEAIADTFHVDYLAVS